MLVAASWFEAKPGQWKDADMAKKYPMGVQIVAGLVIGFAAVWIFYPSDPESERDAPEVAAEQLQDSSKEEAGYVCSQAEAETMVQIGTDAGIILNVGMFDGAPSVFVDRAVWADLALAPRLGLVTAVECATVGPESRLLSVVVRSKGGERLAEWNGVTRRLDLE